MARHSTARAGTRRPTRATRWRRVLRMAALAVVWLGGLAVGIYSLLSVAATYSCGRSAHGLACRPAGTALGALLVVAVIVVVTAVTVMAPDARRTGRLAGTVTLGLVVLAGFYFGARALLSTA